MQRGVRHPADLWLRSQEVESRRKRINHRLILLHAGKCLQRDGKDSVARKNGPNGFELRVHAEMSAAGTSPYGLSGLHGENVAAAVAATQLIPTKFRGGHETSRPRGNFAADRKTSRKILFAHFTLIYILKITFSIIK